MKGNETIKCITSRVNHVQSCIVPSMKGKVLKVKVEGVLPHCVENYSPPLLFEPEKDELAAIGLECHEALVAVDDNGYALVPVENYDCTKVCMDEGFHVGTVKYLDSVSSELNSLNTVSASAKNGVHEANVKADSVQLVKEECMHDSTVSGVSVQESCEKRMEQLLNALNLPAGKLTEHQYQLLVELVKNYSDVFALTDKELGCTSIVQHVIHTGDHSPIRHKPYRVPVVYREKISQMISDMKEQGVIRPSHSPWASPVVLVPKKDG